MTTVARATLSIYGIDPAFLLIDGQRAVARPRDPNVVYVVAPPEVFDVAVGQHALVYDLAGGAVAMQSKDAESIAREIKPPIAVRVNVPAEGITLHRIDRFLIDERGIQTPTGYTGDAPVVAVPATPDSRLLAWALLATGAGLALLAVSVFGSDE